MQTTLKSLLFTFLNLTVFSVCIFSLLGYLGKYNYYFDLLSSFRIQYLYACLVLFPVAIILSVINKKSLWILITVIITILLNIIDVYPYVKLTEKNKINNTSDITVILANILTSNNKYKLVLDLINRESPDIVAIQEVDKIWTDELKILKESYPYYYEHPRTDNFGLSVYSKLPLINVNLNHYSYERTSIPYITFNCVVSGKKINFITLHTLPPFNEYQYLSRNRQLRLLSDWVIKNDGPSVVIGDLNITPFSYHFKLISKKARLVAARKGNGLYPSWRTNFPFWARIPIDLILHTNELETISIKTCDDIGSDHFPVLVKLSVIKDP